MSTTTTDLMELWPDPETPIPFLPPSQQSTDNQRDRTRYQVVLHSILQDYLPPEGRDLIQWYYLEGKTQQEIAKELNITPSAVSKKSKKAFSQLQDYALFFEDVYQRVHQEEEKTKPPLWLQ